MPFKDKVYAVRCFEGEKIYFIKTMYNKKDTIYIKLYQYINKQLMLNQQSWFHGFHGSDDHSAFLSKEMKDNEKIAESSNDKGLISDVSYRYEADANGHFQPKYMRKLDLTDKEYKLRKYNGTDFEDIIKKEDVHTIDGEVKSFRLSKDELKAKEKEIKIAMQIFEAYDHNYDFYNELSKIKKGNRVRAILLFNPSDLEIEYKFNVNRDYNIPYHYFYQNLGVIHVK